nr:MAG: DNA polymerase [Diabrotica toursvirus 3a]
MDIYIYDWKLEEINESRNFHTEIRIYGITQKDQSVCLALRNVKTRLLLECENDLLSINLEQLKARMSSLIYNKKDVNSVKIVKRRRLYDVESKIFPFVEIFFSSRIGMFSFIKRLSDLPWKFTPLETKSSTELQVMVRRHIQPCGWIHVKNFVSANLFTVCDLEIEIDNENQITSSDVNSPVYMKVLSWDIEAKCKTIGKNPGSDITDCVFQISCCVKKNATVKYLLTLGECDQFSDDVTILYFDSEKELILGFAQLIKNEKPNILTGWNIFSFDTVFMINRAEHHKILNKFLTFGYNLSPGTVVSSKWNSKAFLKTDISYIECEGILSIDLIEVVRRDYKLDSYSLNAASEHFLKNKKDDITFQDLMNAYEKFKNKEDHKKDFSAVGKYCVQDSNLVLEMFDKLQTWLSLSEMSKTTSTPVMAVHIQGQQKKFYSQIYKYCYENDIVVDSRMTKGNDSYAGAYVFDPVPGLYEYVVPLDFASLYPSIIIAYNLDYTTICSPDVPLKEGTYWVMEWEDHYGCPHDQNIIQKKTLDHLILNADKDVKKKLVAQRAALRKKLPTTVMCKSHKFHVKKHEFYGKGVIPTIIQNLLDKRKLVRNEMKKITDSDHLALLNQKQLSYKISANSMYGATGVKSGSLPLMEIAMCVTYTGRSSIQKAAEILKSLGGFIVYGDTDSNYVTFDIKGKTHKEKCELIWDKAIKVSKEISAHFPPPMKIDFEEVIYSKFMILTKKRYMYLSCDEHGNGDENKIGKKGVLLSRRDNCAFIKKVYEEVVMAVFKGCSKDEVIDMVKLRILELFDGTYKEENLKITKSVNDYDNCVVKYDEKSGRYRMGNYVIQNPELGTSRLPAQVQLEIKMIERGEEKSEGSRIEYIVLNKPGAKKQCDKIENFKYYMNNKHEFPIDYSYYAERLLEPIDQIFISIYKTGIKEDLKKLIKWLRE